MHVTTYVSPHGTCTTWSASALTITGPGDQEHAFTIRTPHAPFVFEPTGPGQNWLLAADTLEVAVAAMLTRAEQRWLGLPFADRIPTDRWVQSARSAADPRPPADKGAAFRLESFRLRGHRANGELIYSQEGTLEPWPMGFKCWRDRSSSGIELSWKHRSAGAGPWITIVGSRNTRFESLVAMAFGGMEQIRDPFLVPPATRRAPSENGRRRRR